MDLSLVGAFFLFLGIVSWTRSRTAFIVVLSASAPLITTAAVTVGGSSVPPFHLLAIPATVSALVTVAREGLVSPGPRLLAGFAVWAMVVTAYSPALFAGLPVLEPRGGIDNAVQAPVALMYTVSMAAQVVYLMLGVGVVLFLSQSRQLQPGVLTPGVVLGTLASAATVWEPVDRWVGPLFRDYASAQFNPFEVRHSGVFAEPSYLAAFSFAALLYCAHRALASTGWRRAGLVAVAVAALVNGFLTQSGTFAAATALAGVALLVGGTVRLLRHGLPTWAALTLIVGALVLALENRPLLALFDLVNEKLLTDSFGNRTESNVFSLDLLLDTWGLGAGLGANRPSSFALLLLSNVGIIGFALYAALAVRAVRSAAAVIVWRPVATIVCALLLAKVLAEPALSTPLLWFGLGVCLHAERWGSPALTPPRAVEDPPTRRESSAHTPPRRAHPAPALRAPGRPRPPSPPATRGDPSGHARR